MICVNRQTGTPKEEGERLRSLPLPIGRLGQLLAAAESVHIDRQLLDGRIAQARGPGGHDAMARGADLRLDGLERAAIEPDLVVERGTAQLGQALAALAVAGGAVFRKEQLAVLDSQLPGI